MNFSELIKHRQSNRAYENKAVEREKIEQCLEAGRLAPSANNSQGWTFVVVDDDDLKNAITDTCGGIYGNKWAKQAPIIIALVAEKPILMSRMGSKLRKIDFSSLDLGIVAAHICLQAADIGLGTCMIEGFNEKTVKSVLNIPENKKIALLITLGYPADSQRNKKRKEFTEVVKFNKYQ